MAPTIVAEDRLTSGHRLSHPPPGDEVLITGVSGYFPDSDSVVHLQENLFNKVDLVTDDERRWKRIMHPDMPKRFGKINKLNKFDASFFNINFREAHSMEPMGRILLEKAYEAIYDAGLNPEELRVKRVAVIIGVFYAESLKTLFYDRLQDNPYGLSGCSRSMLANRISYWLGVTGPSYVLDTACSSSLFALEHAFRYMRDGNCDYAIVAGSNLCLSPSLMMQFSRVGMLSPDGCSKSFDNSANGYARAETIAAVFLQKAKDARRSYAQVVYAKTNCDGYKEHGITYPATSTQKELLQEFYEECSIVPQNLEFVEAHGTGTKVGDPVELAAIDEIFCTGRSEPLKIGSIKSNLGHGESASGVSSIAKMCIAYTTGYIPPNIHYKTQNENAPALIENRLQVVTEKIPWNRGLSGISSFGFGGANAHILLQNFSEVKINNGMPIDDVPRLVCVSGRTESAVARILDELETRTVDVEFVRMLHAIHEKDIKGHDFRGYSLLCSTPKKAVSLYRSVQYFSGEHRPVWFVYSGMGSQWAGMGAQLMGIPVFAAAIQKCHKALESKGINLTSIITEPDQKIFDSIINSYICITAVQIGLTDVLTSIGIKPDNVIGLNVGKISCAYAIKLMTAEQTILLSYDQSFDQNREKTKSGKDEEFYREIPHNAITIEIAPSGILGNALSEVLKDVVYVTLTQKEQKNNGNLFCGLGKLYEAGLNPRLANIYPHVQFPVSQGTHMLSHLVEWDHGDDWYVVSYKVQSNKIDYERVENISLKNPGYEYFAGHNVDGRILYPATGYLVLVWETLAMMMEEIYTELSVVFENVRFQRATNIPKEGNLEFIITIQKGSGEFEITENGTSLVTGIIYAKENVGKKYKKQLLPPEATGPNIKYLEAKNFYKELRLRGYQYSGLFRGVLGCNVQGTRGQVVWANNWVTFLDSLLQLTILSQDTRGLFIPVRIEKLSIDVSMHNNACRQEINTYRESLDVTLNLYTQIVRCGGVEVRGVHDMPLNRKLPRGVPVLEKNLFIPNFGYEKLKIDEVLRAFIQLVLENTHIYKVKTIELVDFEYEKNNIEIVLEKVQNVLEDMPMVRADLHLISEKEIKTSQNINVSKSIRGQTNATIVIGANLLYRPEVLDEAVKILRDKCFIISREKDRPDPKLYADKYDTICIHDTGVEYLVLFRKRVGARPAKFLKVQTTDHTYAWINEVKENLQNNQKLVLVNQNEDINGLLGLVNCLRKEPGGEIVYGLLIADPSAPAFNPDLEFYKEQLDKDLAINVYQNGQWGTYRHLLLDNLETFPATHGYVNITAVGDLSSLQWLEGPLSENYNFKDPDDYLVHVYSAALNFRDVMTSAGRVAVSAVARGRLAQECVQGCEVAGRTKNGCRVISFIQGRGLSNLSSGYKPLTWTIPDEWSFEEAVTVPVAYATTYLALVMKGQMQRGESILIHAGSGGVGQAAINVALHYGCEIFTTVGTAEKRAFIKKLFPQLKDSHIGSSRNTSFEQMIQRETDGKGVDIVLNSLTDDKLQASVRCLRPQGRFLEIGKVDIANNTPINLEVIDKGISFHGVMLDFARDPDFGDKQRDRLRNLLLSGVVSGAVRPLPYCTFEKNEVETAYRYMAAGKHIGKVVINIREEEKTALKCPPKYILVNAMPRYFCNDDHVYIIVGGLGGFGLELADWLILRGARKLMLTSRRGVSNGYQSSRLRAWASYGADVQISTHDITTESGCEAMLKAANVVGPVDAIFNLAVILKDAIFQNQTPESFRISYGPKAAATINLDKLSRTLCPKLKNFVVFSSVSCGRGNAGQTNYGYANSVMERVCERRKKLGLPALAVQWGAIGDVGLVADMQEEDVQLEIAETLQQRISSCLLVLDKFLKQDAIIVSSMVVAEKKAVTSSAGGIIDIVANIIGIKNLETVSQQVSLAELGMDSMMAVEIKQTLEREFEIFVTAQDIRTLTFAKLVELNARKDQHSSPCNPPVPTVIIEQNPQEHFVSENKSIDGNDNIDKTKILETDKTFCYKVLGKEEKYVS